MRLKGVLRAVFPGAILCGIAVVIFVLGIFISGSHKKSLLAMDQEISDLRKQVNTAEETSKGKVQQLTKDTTGADLTRVAKDDQIVESFLKKTFSWTNLDEYQAQRTSLMEEYGLSKDSSFLQTFMPDILTVEDAAGNEYMRENVNIVQTNYDSMSSRVTDISGDVYTYFTEVTLEVEDVNRPGSNGSALCVFSYDTDAKGNLSNLSGYTVVDQQR